jgi:N-acetylmuramic acid 6-phosphate etherase
VKTAIVMLLADVDVEEARRRLDATDGFVRPAIEGI